jgi:hypothetical protein
MRLRVRSLGENRDFRSRYEKIQILVVVSLLVAMTACVLWASYLDYERRMSTLSNCPTSCATEAR